jgi:hypothetical protein
MCFVHSGSGVGLIQEASVGAATAAAFSSVAAGAVGGLAVAGFGAPEVVAGPGGVRVLDGFGRVLHNRWNRDLPRVLPHHRRGP